MTNVDLGMENRSSFSIPKMTNVDLGMYFDEFVNAIDQVEQH
jgi:hypothetical protein